MAERPDSPSFRAGLKNALAAPLDMLRDAGVRGLELVDEGDWLTLLMTSAELVDALNGAREDLDLSRELASLVDAVDSAVAAAIGWTRRRRLSRRSSASRTRPSASSPPTSRRPRSSMRSRRSSRNRKPWRRSRP